MTRFARAKGSKSSNERVPNEATPWHVMKEQLLQNSDQPKEYRGKTKSAKELLKEKEEPFYYDNIGNVNTDWAEFEETPNNEIVSKNEVLNTSVKEKKKRKSQGTTDGGEEVNENNSQQDAPSIKKKKVSLSSTSRKSHCSLTHEKIDKDVIEAENGIVAEETQSPKKLHKKQKIMESALNKSFTDKESINVSDNDTVTKLRSNVTHCESIENESKKPKKKKKKKNVDILKPDTDNAETDGMESGTGDSKKLSKLNENDDSTVLKSTKSGDNSSPPNLNTTEETTKNNETSHAKLSKRQKRNLKHKKNNSENHSKNSGSFNAEGNEWDNDVQFGKRRKSEADQAKDSKEDGHKDTEINQIGDSKEENDNSSTNKSKGSQEVGMGPNKRVEKFKQKNIDQGPAIKRKAPKIRDDKEHKRRKPIPASKKIIVNGVEIEIVMFDGFPVKKEDAERLADLKQKMIMKGIPKSEVAAAMKLERRKAEKALTRVKKFVCYHCRKSGHNLSDCPELVAEQAGTGICFKCGSTEHTHFECKVTKGAEYRHATCFICREQGHIAKQCPDNPKGVYPQGGACKVCGDVTHLKKDCPDLAKQKEDGAITVDTIANSNLESLEEETTKVNSTSDIENLSTKIVKF